MTGSTIDVTLSAIDRITAPINAIQRRIERLTAPFGRVGRAVSDLGNAAGLGRLTQSIGGVGRALGNVTTIAAQTTAQLAALAGVSLAGVGAGLYGVLRTGGEFERYEIMLTGLMGTKEAAVSAMAWAEKFAQSTNLSVAQAVESYIRLKNVGIDPTLGALQAITDANAKMGGSYEQQEGIVTAIGQMWSKTKISAEEMQQLSERNIAGWQLLSRATGKTVAQLQELGSEGKLGQDYIRALVTQMGKEAKGASEAIGGSWDGILDRMGDAWQTFNKIIADAGVFDAAKAGLEELLALVQRLQQNGQLTEWAKSVSDAMTSYLVKPMRDFLFGTETIGDSLANSIRTPGFLVELPKHVGDAMAAVERMVEALKAFARFVAPLVDLVGGPFNAALLALGAITFGPLIAALASLTGAFITLGVAILATPVGWFIAAVAAIAAAAYLIYENWDGIVAYFQDVWANISAAFDEGIVGGIMVAVREFNPGTHIARAMNAVVEHITGIDLLSEGSRIIGSLLQGFSQQFAAFDQWLGGLEGRLIAFGASIVTWIGDGLKSQWASLVEWVRSAFDDLTSWMPEWARDKLGLSATMTETTRSIAEAATAPGVSVPVGATPGLLAPTATMPATPAAAASAPVFAMPSFVPPPQAAPSSTSEINTTTVEAGNVTASTMNLPDPLIAHQPQNVTVNAPLNVGGVSGLGLTAPEVMALIERVGRAHSERVRQDVSSALGY